MTMGCCSKLVEFVLIVTVVSFMLAQRPEWFGFEKLQVVRANELTLGEKFGIQGLDQLKRDVKTLAYEALITKRRFQVGLSSAGLLRPSMSIPAYLGWIPKDRKSPIYNFFDRSGGGKNFTTKVTRDRITDYRGGKANTYDDHDGVDFVMPIGTELTSSAPGTVSMIRFNWLRGGTTVAVDHGHGVVTTYTHCARILVEIGEKVKRGQVIALSGAQGVDLVLHFPFVPPHVHYMVWLNGKPVDPFMKDGESSETAVWTVQNDPKPVQQDETKDEIETVAAPGQLADKNLLKTLISLCREEPICTELKGLEKVPEFVLVSTLEEIIHHERWAFHHNPALLRIQVRKRSNDAQPVKINLPMKSNAFIGADMTN